MDEREQDAERSARMRGQTHEPLFTDPKLRWSCNSFILPRYGSLYVQSDDEHFNGYVADIDRFYARKLR
jgi:hypothetical protein